MEAQNVYVKLYTFFFYTILRWSVAVWTMRRQSSQIAAFLKAEGRRKANVLLAYIHYLATPGFMQWRQNYTHENLNIKKRFQKRRTNYSQQTQQVSAKLAKAVVKQSWRSFGDSTSRQATHHER